MEERMSKKFLTLILGLVTCYFVLLAGASLNWRMMHDSAVFMYMAFLMDRLHMIPYRDFFDVNLLGTYLVYILAGRVSGYGDLGFRLFDLAWLGALMTLTYIWLRPAGRHSAWAGGVGLGLAYLQGGPLLSMQRDFLLLLPIAAALTVLRGDRNTTARAIAAGAGIGFAALIKPQAALFILPVWFVNFFRRDGQESHGSSPLAGSAGMAAGFSIPLALSALWLARNHALGPFLQMASGYYPLYGNLFENKVILNPLQRINVILTQVPGLGGQALWLIPAGLGMYLGLAQPPGNGARTRVLTVMTMTLIAILLPAVSGQFFPYHWLPLQFFAIIGAALCLQEIAPGRDRITRTFPPLVFLAALALCALPQKGLLKPITGEKFSSPKTARADAIAQELAPRLRPGDLVQPLDWTSGALHAMLELRARPATRFLYTSLFHHHVFNPYILELRKQFLDEIQKARPRFIIRIDADRPWFVGPLTDMTFPDFDNYMALHYREIARGQGFVIFENVSSAGGKL